MKFEIQNTFNTRLVADPIKENYRRQVPNAHFSSVIPKVPSNPSLIHVADEVAEFLGISEEDTQSREFLDVFSGAKVLKGSEPYAMCYGGFQFGNWAGQLGDGRAINLFEAAHKGKRWALQLKGSGETPYSRTADGLAVLRSSIREHLCSEAMHHLGIPTTRSLCLSLSGDQVLRDMLYDGNAAYEKGAIVCRVSPCFIRFGNFDIFASRQDKDNIKRLADYIISEFYPEINLAAKDAYLSFFRVVAENTLDMIVHWQRVGFVHGVMNTDNMSIHGLTIDYGPYGWLEGYDPNWTPNTTDNQMRRYRFGNQPQIGLWNLLQLANSIYPLIEESDGLEQVLHDYSENYNKKYMEMMRSKLGLSSEQEGDKKLILDLESTLRLTETDMTIFFRNLANTKKGMSVPEDISCLDHIIDAFYKPEKIRDAFYKPEEVKDHILAQWNAWLNVYVERLQKESDSDEKRRAKMNKVNPKYVLRNYMAQMAIEKADEGDYNLIDTFYRMLKRPYDEQEEYQEWFAKRPEWARNKVGCSALSCSS